MIDTEITLSENMISMSKETFSNLVQSSYKRGYMHQIGGYDYNDKFGENCLVRLLTKSKEIELEERFINLSKQYEKLSNTLDYLIKKRKK